MKINNELVELLADVKEQVLYLQELGVASFDVELPKFASSRDITAGTQEEKLIPGETPQIPELPVKATVPAAASRISHLPSLSQRKSVPPVPPVSAVPPETVEQRNTDSLFVESAGSSAESTETIEDIRTDIGNCTRCPLHEGRTQVVHTTGNFQADLMFIGEAPGADEDAKGEPFVGRAGRLLTQIIEAIGFKREDVVIGNINRCRPPGNRQPTLPEAHTCKPFLLREIAVIRPRVIVVLGNTALHNLLDTKIGITKMRGRFHDHFGVKVMPTFHPAYLLRDPSKKREVWEDMKKVRDFLSDQ